MPEAETVCEYCGNTECTCARCPNCDERFENCNCSYCYYCGNHEEDCICGTCDYCGYNLNECDCVFCPDCGEHEEDCICERCSFCNNLLDDCECLPEEQALGEMSYLDREIYSEAKRHYLGPLLPLVTNEAYLESRRYACRSVIRNRNRITSTAPTASIGGMYHYTIDMENPAAARFGQLKIVPKELKFDREDIFAQMEFDTPYKLNTTPHSILAPQGVDDLRRWLRIKFGIQWTYTLLSDLVGLEENIQRHTYTQEGESYNMGGKFINRLSKIIQKRHMISLTEADKNAINALIHQQWVGGENFWIDRPKTVNWESGAFGEKDKKSEDGSCWWYSGGLDNPKSRIGIFRSQMPEWTGAIRLWTGTERTLRGVGRVWYIRTRKEGPILFNGYGLTTLQWAAKLSKHFNVKEYKEVSLSLSPDLIVNNSTGILFDVIDGRYKNLYGFDLIRKEEYS